MEVTIVDSFDVRGRVAIEYGASGVVVIFDASQIPDRPKYGETVLVIRPDRWMVCAEIGEAKGAPEAFGIFFKGLTKEQVPIGSRLRWGRQFWPAADEVSRVKAVGQ